MSDPTITEQYLAYLRAAVQGDDAGCRAVIAVEARIAALEGENARLADGWANDSVALARAEKHIAALEAELVMLKGEIEWLEGAM